MAASAIPKVPSLHLCSAKGVGILDTGDDTPVVQCTDVIDQVRRKVTVLKTWRRSISRFRLYMLVYKFHTKRN